MVPILTHCLRLARDEIGNIEDQYSASYAAEFLDDLIAAVNANEQELSAHETVIANYGMFNGDIPMPTPEEIAAGIESYNREKNSERGKAAEVWAYGKKETQDCRLVSYADDGSTCTLNFRGEELYFNRLAEQQVTPVSVAEAAAKSLCLKAIRQQQQAPELTDDEIRAIFRDCLTGTISAVRAAIAAHEAKRAK